MAPTATWFSVVVVGDGALPPYLAALAGGLLGLAVVWRHRGVMPWR